MASLGDCNCDSERTLADFTAACSSGPTSAPESVHCACADMDGDGDVDLRDFGLFAVRLQTRSCRSNKKGALGSLKGLQDGE